MESRKRVAKEAARLIYTGVIEEYKHAKETASMNLGINSMPSNYEVAIELDNIATQMEGKERERLLVKLRNEAFGIMRIIKEFNPSLIGSVWRGTARKGSDIDITVYAHDHEDVVSKLKKFGFFIEKVEETVASKKGQQRRSWHILLKQNNNVNVEIVVRPPEERWDIDLCEIYGDEKKGLDLTKLENIMQTDPIRKFIPRRRRL